MFAIISTTMSQDLIQRMRTKAPGGKGHVYYLSFNKKGKAPGKDKLTLKKFNKFTRKHEVYEMNKK